MFEMSGLVLGYGLMLLPGMLLLLVLLPAVAAAQWVWRKVRPAPSG